MKKILLIIVLMLFVFQMVIFAVTYTSQYPTAHNDTYVKVTSYYSASYYHYFATDPALSLTGTNVNNAWGSASGNTTNQRFHIDLGSTKTIKRIYYENNHASGANTNLGVNNFTFWGSNTGAGSFDDLVYANDEGWTQLTIAQSTFDQHTASDVADPKYIVVTNSTAYRYYAFKFADNHLSGGTYMGVRHVALQTEDGYSWLSGYTKRIKLTIDNTKVDSALSNFPATIFLGEDKLPFEMNRSCRRPGGQAIYDSTANKTFMVFVGTDADPYASYYDHSTKVWATPVKIGDALEEDYHVYPMIVIDSSGYLHVFYGAHNATMRYAKSNSVRDISAWTDSSLANATYSSYPFPVIDDGGDIYVFYRRWQSGTDATYHRPLYYVKSTDGGSNWGVATVAIENTNADHMEEIYVGKIAHEPAHDSIPDKVHFCWTMAGGASHDQYHEDIHYAYFKFSDEHFYSAGNTDLGTVIDNTELEANTKVLDTGVASGKDTPYENFVSFKLDGTPILAYGSSPDDNWYYAEWNGSSWDTVVIVSGYVNGEFRDLTYQDSKIKILRISSTTLYEYESSDGSNFSTALTLDLLYTPTRVNYVMNYTSPIRFIYFKYPAANGVVNQICAYEGENPRAVFTEFDADTDYMKCAFTTSDGETQLYAEKEFFDVSAQKAIYHVKVTSISSSADTDIYYYYNNSIADNTTYIGAINTTAGATVWDNNFKLVIHGVDNTTSSVLDSTSNNNDGTKKGANEPIEADGKIHKGQDFDGVDDYISHTTVTQTLITLEFLSYQHTKGDSDYPRFFQMPGYVFGLRSEDVTPAPIMTPFFTSERSTNDGEWTMPENDIVYNTQYYLAVTYDSTDVANNPLMYRNGNSRTVTERDGKTPSGTQVDNAGTGYIGNNSGGTRSYDGVLDEIRISNNIRSAAWLKATYNSLWDTLLTYGSEETKPSEDNAIFFGFNF